MPAWLSNLLWKWELQRKCRRMQVCFKHGLPLEWHPNHNGILICPSCTHDIEEISQRYRKTFDTRQRELGAIVKLYQKEQGN